MDHHASEYYSAHSEESPHGHFHRVIQLNEEPLIEWQEASKMAPGLCRGWYELAQLSAQERIEFTQEFWLTKLPYHQQLNDFLKKFFLSLDDIGVFLTQQKYDDPFEASLVYSFADNGGFFRGNEPATEQDILSLQKAFPGYTLPADYLAFLSIHNGFAKLTDTGVIKSSEMGAVYSNFQKMLEKENSITTSKGVAVNPHALIPFYQSFGMSFFQCFWGDWYSEQEMGNVYYSSTMNAISDCTKTNDCIETMAFETFIDWLMFYLEKID